MIQLLYLQPGEHLTRMLVGALTITNSCMECMVAMWLK